MRSRTTRRRDLRRQQMSKRHRLHPAHHTPRTDVDPIDSDCQSAAPRPLDPGRLKRRSRSPAALLLAARPPLAAAVLIGGHGKHTSRGREAKGNSRPAWLCGDVVAGAIRIGSVTGTSCIRSTVDPTWTNWKPACPHHRWGSPEPLAEPLAAAFAAPP